MATLLGPKSEVPSVNGLWISGPLGPTGFDRSGCYGATGQGATWWMPMWTNSARCPSISGVASRTSRSSRACLPFRASRRASTCSGSAISHFHR